VIDSPHPSRYGSTDLMDTILGLQVITNATVSQPIGPWTDVSSDGKTGMAEVLYSLQKSAGLR
jgi:hypothetical protein